MINYKKLNREAEQRRKKWLEEEFTKCYQKAAALAAYWDNYRGEKNESRSVEKRTRTNTIRRRRKKSK